MTCYVFILTVRNPKLTYAKFRDHYENTHVPILRKGLGDTFPYRNTRHYIKEDGADGLAAIFVMGNPKDVPFDAITVLEFQDEAARTACMMRAGDEAFQKVLAEDEEKFLDRNKCQMILVGSSVLTTNDKVH